MACMRYSQIRATPGNTIRYIANRDKMLSPGVHDISNVLSYMGEPESTERVYAFGHHCSANPELASKQMALYRARYYERRGIVPKEKELLGIHLFLSYSREDAPGEAVMNEIAEKLCTHPLFQNHAAFAAHHYDKAHRHTHIYVSNFSAKGKPKKLCMQYKDYNDLRKYANRLCVEHGLSIIDLPALRYKDPEYSAWIDSVIADGRITIHPEREEHRGSRHQGASTRQIYFRNMKEREEAILAEEKLLTPAQLRSKRAREKYCWNFANDPTKPGYLYQTPNGRRYHAIRLYDDKGRKRTLVELICLLLIAIYQYEKRKNDPPQEPCRSASRMKPDYKLQAMVDSGSIARELNIQTAEDVQKHILDTGRQIGALKREKVRHENSLRCHEEILAAWDTYQTANPGEDAFRQAYAILARNQILSEEAVEGLRIRYRFEQQKILDYDKRIPKLNRRYRALKYLENMLRCPEAMVEEFRRELVKTEETLEEKIRAAEKQKLQGIKVPFAQEGVREK